MTEQRQQALSELVDLLILAAEEEILAEEAGGEQKVPDQGVLPFEQYRGDEDWFLKRDLKVSEALGVSLETLDEIYDKMDADEPIDEALADKISSSPGVIKAILTYFFARSRSLLRG